MKNKQQNTIHAAPVAGSGNNITSLLTPDVAEHLRVLARRFVYNERLPDDLAADIEHDLVEAVGNAAEEFRPEVATFSTFASRVAKNKLVDISRRLKHRRNVLTCLQDEVGFDEDANAPILLIDTIADTNASNERERRELCLSVREAVALLDGVEREVCERIMRGDQARDIRKELGLRKWRFYSVVIPAIAEHLEKHLALDRNPPSARTKERDVGRKERH